MLARTTYDQAYVDTCRARIDALLAAYGSVDDADGFEPLCFNQLVLALDNWFVHRLRKHEGKDGNPLNEVRVIASSLMENDGKLLADKQIKLKPEDSVLGLAVGDEIALSADDFARLSSAFLAEVEARFV